MAMKLNAKEKANDSIIRAYNKQIERAYKELGYHNTVTQNLVNKAKSIFGENNIKTLRQKTYHGNQINKSTGEVFEIPQIARTRATLSTDNAKALQKATKYATDKSKYLSMYDVTKTHQKAIDKAMSHKRQNVPADILAINDTQKKIKETKKYVQNITAKDIQREMLINDLSSEIFEAYEEAKENDDDITLYQEFAHSYHNGDDITLKKLQEMADLRYEQMVNRSLNNQTTTDITDSILGNLSDFVDIL